MASRKRSISNDSDVSALYKEWDGVSCPICMDHPHNAVLLICSSHEKGCRSFICDTSYRHSNCLDRFKKLKEENAETSSTHSIPGSHQNSVGPSTATMNLESWIGAGAHSTDPVSSAANSATDAILSGGSSGHSSHDANSGSEERIETPDIGVSNMEKSEEGHNLRCPLCRGSVLRWEVVEEVRNYLNMKSRSCSSESCAFTGNYRELRRHARRVHPMVRPADIDPSRQREWHRLEDQREYSDIVSAITSAMPGAVVFGDYVIENGDRLSAERDRGGGRWLGTFFLFHMFGSMDSGANPRGSRPRLFPTHRHTGGTLSRRRHLWGENLLGLQDNRDEYEGDDDELNIHSDQGDDLPTNPRRRRRLTRDQSDGDQP